MTGRTACLLLPKIVSPCASASYSWSGWGDEQSTLVMFPCDLGIEKHTGNTKASTDSVPAQNKCWQESSVCVCLDTHCMCVWRVVCVCVMWGVICKFLNWVPWLWYEGVVVCTRPYILDGTGKMESGGEKKWREPSLSQALKVSCTPSSQKADWTGDWLGPPSNWHHSVVVPLLGWAPYLSKNILTKKERKDIPVSFVTSLLFLVSMLGFFFFFSV